MKLQHKAWGLVLVTVGLLTLVAIWGAGKSVSATFFNMEQAQAEVEGERARRLLAQQMSSLAATLKDYAYWGETVDLVNGRQDGYLGDNFTTDNMKSLRISEATVFDLQGQAVAGIALNALGALEPITESHTRLLQSLLEPVLKDPRGDTVVTTYHVATDTCIWLQ